jgi:hypothetical protein
MGDWPLFGGGQKFDTYLERTATSDGTPITVASTNTKGAWITVVDPIPYNVASILVDIRQSVAGSPSCLVDLGISTSGGTTGMAVVVPDLLFSSRLGHPSIQWLPIALPEGARLNVRCQSTSTSNIPQATVTLIGGNFAGNQSFSKMVAYGATAADSGGISIVPSTATHTKGAWSEITASTTCRAKWLLAAFTAAANTAQTDCSWLADIAIGDGGSETILIPDLLLGTQTASDVLTPQMVGPIPVDIPEGTRLAVRAQCSIVDAADKLFDCALYTIG